jgi:hypothetical protein
VFGPTRDRSIVQRGIDEALACRDVLPPAPARTSLLDRLVIALGAVARRLAPTHSRAKDAESARPMIARTWR